MAAVATANSAWESLLRAQVTLARHFAAENVWDGISMKEYDVLYTLTKSPHGLRLAELNQGVLLSQPALSRMVDRLGSRGLITRCADPADGRGVLIELTQQGRRLQRTIGREHARSVRGAMAAALSSEELAQLETLCDRLAASPAVLGRANHVPRADHAPRANPEDD